METMKRKWGKPVTGVQQFAPSEYVAQCVKLWSPHREFNGVPGLQSTAVTVSNNQNQQFIPYLSQVNEGYLQEINDGQHRILPDDNDIYIANY